MVFVVIRLFEIEGWVVFGDFNQFPFQICEQTIVDYLSTVFGREYDVVIAEVDGVGSATELAWHGLKYSRVPRIRVRTSSHELTLGGLCVG